MICVYCGQETGDEHDEHAECVEEALSEPLGLAPATDLDDFAAIAAARAHDLAD